MRKGFPRADREDKIRACSTEQLYEMSRSGKHFAVLLMRKLCSREQRKGRSVKGGRMGKLPLDREILERVEAAYFIFYPSVNRDKEWKECVSDQYVLVG